MKERGAIMTERDVHYSLHSYKGEGHEEHWRVYGNEGEMIDTNQKFDAPGANENMADNRLYEAAHNLG